MAKTGADGAQLRDAMPGVLLLCIAIAGVLGAVFASSVWGGPVDEPTALTPSSVASYTWAPTPETALFIGDSYAAGTGAEDPSDRWTTVVSREMGWNESNRGLGGTGYYSTGPPEACGRETCPSFDDYLADLADEVRPDVVVVSGGLNDLGLYHERSDAVDRAIHDTYAAAARIYPEAEIIAVGPSTPGSVPESAIKMDAAVQRAAASEGAMYISLINPPVVESHMVLEDRGHVGADGHAAIAERVVSSLRQAAAP